jgi:hypothetical protein
MEISCLFISAHLEMARNPPWLLSRDPSGFPHDKRDIVFKVGGKNEKSPESHENRRGQGVHPL